MDKDKKAETFYENELFDQAVIAFIAAEIAHNGIHESCPEDELIETARLLTAGMMGAR